MNSFVDLSFHKSLLEKILVILSAFLIFLIVGPFFIWETYKGGILSSSGFPLLKSMYVITLMLGLVYLVLHKGTERTSFKCAGSLLICGIILGLVCGSGNANVSILLLMNVAFLSVTLCYPRQLKIDIYKYFIIIFGISIIPGIFYSILAFVGIKIPYDILLPDSEIKTTNYIQYLHYPFAIQISVKYDLLDNWNRFRVCGMFDEPGRLGTMCALILVSEKFNLKNRLNICILVAGLLSFSVAFFLIALIYYIFDSFLNKRRKRAYVLILLLIAFIAFKNIPFENAVLVRLQSRLSFSSSGFTADNRTNENFLGFINNFFNNSSLISIILGNGSGSTNQIMTNLNNGYSSSFLALIYDYGVLGFTMIVLWPVYFWLVNRKHNRASPIALILLIVNLLNLYQRPSAFSPAYLYPLIGGIYVINGETDQIVYGINDLRKECLVCK